MFSRYWTRNLLAVSLARSLHATPQSNAADKSYQFVVCGAGAGGLAVGSTLCRKFGPGKVAIIEPSEVSRWLKLGVVATPYWVQL